MTYPPSAGADHGDHVLGRVRDAEREEAHVGEFGTVSVIVPFDAHVIVTGRAGAWAVHVGRTQSDIGFEAWLTTTMEPGHGDGATITLDLQTGLGDVWVYRVGPTPKELRPLEVDR